MSASRADGVELQGQPVFVVSGLPRSGTSLMMQMLETGGIPVYSDGNRTPDEDNPKGYYEHNAVMALARDASWVAHARGHALKVISTLLPKLPQQLSYRVVLMTRDLDEVVASQGKMLERSGKLGGRITPEDLKRLYMLDLDRARSWVQSCVGAEMIEVAYAEAVGAPAEAASCVADFLDASCAVPLNRERMAGVADPLLYRNRNT